MKTLEQHIKESEIVQEYYNKATIALPYKLFDLDDNHDRSEANKLLHSRINSLDKIELTEAIMIAIDSLKEIKRINLISVNIAEKLIEQNEDTLRSRLDSLTTLELVSFIAQINGRLIALAVEELVISNQ